ncbi:myb-like protein F isoform X2 [Condylostylus longicornis]|uniref:myb-like protein F isoform X2 n=2 Tax=Condylostylus longicornis TaxID=2530218 RepID=UPI00244D9A08|nr:myb-like protein F isoform X2 [Condylostylus longicornis]
MLTYKIFSKNFNIFIVTVITIILMHSKSQNITMAPQLPPSISSSSSFLSDAIIKEGAALKFPLRKNPQDQNNIVLQRQQEHKQKQQQQQHHQHHQMNHQKYYPITDINESKSKSYHKTETTPKHSTELIGRHHHYREHNYNQHHHAHHYNDNHKKIVNINPNIDKMKKNHKIYNINNDENENQNENDNDNNNIDDENDNDKTNKNIVNEDENNEDDDEDDYYYYNEDRNVDNDDDDDNDYDDDNIKENHGILGNLFNNFESKIKDIHINKNSHNVHKKIILNRDYHDNVNDDDGDLNENYNDNDHEDQYQRRYQHVDDDIDLIKKDLINHHEIFNNFEKDFDLYDYIDDEPKDENNTKNNEKSESLTEEKWEKYGSPKAVANSRRRYYSEVQKVNAHIMRVGYEAECRIPKPKIIQISEPSKRYVPHCTIIHKCGDDTGCCQSDFRTCVMKKSQIIDLYFYVVPLGTKEPIVETLSFENHTECHCVERERYRPTSSLSSSSSSSAPLQLIKNDTGNLIQNQQQQQQQLNLNFSLPCKCAKYFTVFEDNNNNNDDNNNNNNNKKNCRCDCVSNDTACLRFKQGEEGFPMDDRNCVIKEGCTVPTCEFGDYSISEGRCPRNEHKRYIRTWNFD